jgi:RNA polymerase sigma factor (sigma-70 family)
MDDLNTEIGGTGRQLPVTSHTALAQIRGGDPRRRDAELERLAQIYWKPVYHLIRRARGARNEDAKDLTQDFFAEVVLQGGFAERYAPDRGSFRAYLKGALRNFLAKQARDGAREKRGGSVRMTSLSMPAADLGEVLPDEKTLRPEEVFDRTWRTVVLDRATRALEERLAAQGKKTYFEVFRRYDLEAGQDRVSYESVARALGLSVDDVKNYLTRSREEFRQAVRAILCESVAGPEQLSAEWKELFGEA